MTEYKLLIDESGSFGNSEKYIILGGVLFKTSDEKALEEYFKPIHQKYCSILGVDELKGSKLGKLKLPMISHIGNKKEIVPIAFIIDKENSFIFDKYDRLCFKYSKAIEWMIKKLEDERIVNTNSDKIHIKIDNINLSKKDKNNFYNWLPTQLDCVKKLEVANSTDFIGLQLADIVANSFSKNRFCNKTDLKNTLLSPIIIFFLKETEEIYIIKD